MAWQRAGELRGRVALVTGGASGIGAAVAVDLARHGADVAIADLLAGQDSGKVLDAVGAAGRRGLALTADVADRGRAREVVAEVRGRLGGVHILVTCAGINRDAMSWKMSAEEWDAVLGVDLSGTFHYCQAVTPIFREQRNGRIVTISSINGLRGKVGQVNYAAAKAGVIGLTKALAKELARSRVTVNAVAPGFILTPMTAGMPVEAREAAIAEIPLGQPGTPEDVAALVTFLCTDRARYITGEVIKVDGGQYI
jgi:NAD(P)-dependent dehydrogenase (short-subunit alcohol dehydrogenase family)